MKRIDEIIKKINEEITESGVEYLADNDAIGFSAYCDYETSSDNTIEVTLDEDGPFVKFFHANGTRRPNDGECPRLADYISSRIIPIEDVKQEYEDRMRESQMDETEMIFGSYENYYRYRGY